MGINSSRLNIQNGGAYISGSVIINDLTASLYGTASYALVAESAEAFPYTGSAVVSGSLFTDSVLIGDTFDTTLTDGDWRFTTSESKLVVQFWDTASSQWETDTIFTKVPVSGSSYVTYTDTASYAFYAQTATSASHAITADTADFVVLEGLGITVNGMQLTASVRSVNGNFPEANGNVATSLTQVVTGTSASLEASSSGAITGSVQNGTVWIISGDPDPDLDGLSYIYSSGSVGQWYQLNSFDYATADARYLRLNPQAPLQGNLDIGGFRVENVADPILDSDAASIGWIKNSGTASYAVIGETASYVNPLSQNVIITGSLSQGLGTTIGGTYAHAEGFETFANGNYAHAEGYQVTASGFYSHAEGYQTTTIGANSHTEGELSVALGIGSHAEGGLTTAAGQYSHAEGANSIAIGNGSHAEGDATTAIGVGSHAEGVGTIASASYQHVEGKYNLVDTDAIWIVGDGTSNGTRSNLIAGYTDKVTITGSLDVSGSYLLNGQPLKAGGVTISDTAPTGSAADTGSLWFNSNDLGIYIRYQDTDGGQWVAASPVGPALSASFAQTASYVRTLYANLGLSGNLVGYGLNSEITWSSVVCSPEITVSNQNITLPAGTWMVNADINAFNFSDTAGGYINVNLMNASNVVIAGTTQANPGPLSGTYNYSTTGQVIGIFTLASPTTVKFRIPAATGTATIASTNTRAIFTSINI